MKKPINLSWLVEKWTLDDENSYLKNIWLNTETLDIIRINQGESQEDLINNYIDIDSDIENFVLMPDASAFDEKRIREAFMTSLDRYQRDEIIDQSDGYYPADEFMDVIYDLGLENQYNDFKDKVCAEILLYWADDESISINKDMETINILKYEV